MASLKQIEANRLNALKSTGPRTAEGKSITRFNAVKHGIFAAAPILIGEDAATFEALRDSYLLRFDPATPEEHTLVSSIVGHAWFLGRFPTIESHIWNFRLEEWLEPGPFPYARAHQIVHQQLGHLQRRIDSTERHFRKDLELLIKLQTARKKADPPAEPTLEPESSQPTGALASPNPEIGFVPANSEPSTVCEKSSDVFTQVPPVAAALTLPQPPSIVT